MITSRRALDARRSARLRRTRRGREPGRESWLLALIAPLARPKVAGLVALVAYLVRASHGRGLRRSDYPYYNLLADAFLHGQLHLRLPPADQHDLVAYAGRLYLYWPPFPAVLVAPLVALFGPGVSDVVYTAVLGAFTVAQVAALLGALDRSGVAPLTPERRAILVAAVAFGSTLLILAPAGRVWFTGQLVGWGCTLLAAIAALAVRGKAGYFLTGLALGCAAATRLSLLFTGLWLAYYLLRRDWRLPAGQRLARAAWGLAPVAAILLLLGWYNSARFGNPLELGLDWHNMGAGFREDYARYGPFNLHYLPTNLYYQFVAYPLLATRDWRTVAMGGGLFWMTPVLLGAPYAIWQRRRDPLVWALALTCVLVYVPIGLLMGTGFAQYGPRYLLDLMVPLLVLTALGVRRWRLDILQALLVVSCLTYAWGVRWWLSLGW